MLPTRLNLLSPAKQTHLRLMMYGQYSRHLLEHLFLVIALSGIILLGGQTLLDSYFQSLASDLTSLSTRQASKNRQIKTINAVLSQTAAIQERYTLWTPLITHIVNAVPDHVTLTAFQLDAPNKTYTFSGLAARREDLLLFQRELQALPQIAAVNIPLPNLIEQQQVRFSFTATLK